METYLPGNFTDTALNNNLLNSFLRKNMSDSFNTLKRKNQNKIRNENENDTKNKNEKVTSDKINDKNNNKTVNITKKQLIKLVKKYHDVCKYELLNSVYEFVLNEIYNNMWGEFSINSEEIDQFLFQFLLKKLHIINKINVYPTLIQDVITDESFNEISSDILEENENIYLAMDKKNNYITVERIYDELVYYDESIIKENYLNYLNDISKLFKQDFSNSDYKKIQKLLYTN